MAKVYTVEVRSSENYAESYGRISGVFSSYWEAVEEIRKMKRRKEFQRTEFISNTWFYRHPTKREQSNFPLLVGVFVHDRSLRSKKFFTLKEVPEEAAHSYIFIHERILNPTI